MYEHLSGYSSIDQLVAEKKDDLQHGLNGLQHYLDIVKSMAHGRREYSIGVFVRLSDENARRLGRKFSRYVSYNNPETGEILSIEDCLDENNPTFSIQIGEERLLKVINNADKIKNYFDEKKYWKILEYVPLRTIRTIRWQHKHHRTEDVKKTAKFVWALGKLLPI
tara:strand:+ start:1436 stop:1933 length:498 start_codon:yes stop_codon:yes gene_type:complete